MGASAMVENDSLQLAACQLSMGSVLRDIRCGGLSWATYVWNKADVDYRPSVFQFYRRPLRSSVSMAEGRPRCQSTYSNHHLLSSIFINLHEASLPLDSTISLLLSLSRI